MEIDPPKITRFSHKDNELNNRRNDKRRKEKDVMHSSNNSIVSAISNYISSQHKTAEVRKSNKIEPKYRRNKADDLQFRKRKKYPLLEKEESSQLQKENNQHTHHMKDKISFSRKHTVHNHNHDDNNSVMEDERTENLPKHKLMEEESTIQQRINDYNDSVQALSNTNANPNVSLVPSAFSKKPQHPDVAREILKLQWKILRSQAKMVKIQERIIRLQAEAEADNEITSANPVYKNAHENSENRSRRKVYRHKELG